MRALVLSDEPAFVTDHPVPGDAADEVSIRVTVAGVCETDLQLVRGYMGFTGVLGHEFVGVAESGAYAGRRVVGEINCFCGRCDRCSRGDGNHCPQRSVLGILNRDGAFAEYTSLPERNLHPVPDNVSDEQAVFVEPLAAAFRITEQIELSRCQSAAVLGDGRLGYLVSAVLRLHCDHVTVYGRHRQKLRIFEPLGVSTIVSDGQSFDRRFPLVVDCTGSQDGLADSLRLVEPRGTIVLKTTTAADSAPPLAGVVIDEVTIIGSRCGPFPPAIQALAEHRINVEPLISERCPLSDGVEAIRRAAQPGVFKVLLDPTR